MRTSLKTALFILALCGRAEAQVSIANEPPASLPTSGSDLAVIDQYNSGLSKWVTKHVPLSALIPPAGITASMMATGAAAYNLGSGGVTATLLAPGAAASNIGAGGVTSSMLAAGSAAANIGTGGINASMLASGVAAANLGAGSIASSMLATGAAAANLGAGSISSSMLNTAILPLGTANAGTVYAPSGAAGVAQITSDMAGFRNRLINGSMQISQRGPGPFTSSIGCSTTCNYTADRWFANGTGAGFTVSQTGGIAGYIATLTMTGASGVTSAYIAQRISAGNIPDMPGSTASLSFNASCSSAQSIQWSIYQPTSADNYTISTLLTSGLVSVGTSSTNYQVNGISLSSANTNGIEIRLYPNSGGSFVGGTCVFTGVQFEPGSYATAFERRPYGYELLLSQRYFVSYTAQYLGVNINTYWAASMLYFPVPMRIVPTPSGVSFPNGGGTFVTTMISLYGTAISNVGGAWSATPGATLISITGQFSAEL